MSTLKASTDSKGGIFGLLGHNISYSLSPAIHNHVFTKYGIRAVYGLFDLPPEHFDGSIGALLDNSSGINVTVPYKEKVIPYLDGLTHEAELTGSVNLIHKHIGYNSDYLALRDLVSATYPEHEGRDCVIFGAGGAARTTAFLLGESGANIRIINRSLERAEKLESDLKKHGIEVEILLLDPEAKKDIFKANIVVNCVSSPEFQYPRIISDLAIDFNYGVRSDNFRSRIEMGSLLITGEKILIGQAVYSQKIWNGIVPSFDDLMGVINVK